MKIYVVVERSGSYSDVYQNNICAFLDSDAAELHAQSMNISIERIKKATNALYQHMNVWSRINVMPEWSYEVDKKYSDLVYNRKRNKNLEKEYQRLKPLHDQMNQERQQWGIDYKLAQDAFYLSLDYLTAEDKQSLTDPTHSYNWNIDSDFNVEELEVKDGHD